MASSKNTPKKKTSSGPLAKKSRRPAGASKGARKWSAHVTQTSDALDLKKGVFKSKNPGKIARSLERSAEKSKRKKSSPYQSAMSMLNFYINRAGKNLPASEKRILKKAKDELKALHDKKETD
jgi:hypothetical protein